MTLCFSLVPLFSSSPSPEFASQPPAARPAPYSTRRRPTGQEKADGPWTRTIDADLRAWLANPTTARAAARRRLASPCLPVAPVPPTTAPVRLVEGEGSGTRAMVSPALVVVPTREQVSWLGDGAPFAQRVRASRGAAGHWGGHGGSELCPRRYVCSIPGCTPCMGAWCMHVQVRMRMRMCMCMCMCLHACNAGKQASTRACTQASQPASKQAGRQAGRQASKSAPASKPASKQADTHT